MNGSAVWRSRPVFVSSTFLDMHHERDHLRHHVFPALEERLRARRSHLEPIDLRWGVETLATEEHAKEVQILKVCLAEVERSRPFLIALLGDRYGRVLPADRIAAAAQEAGFDPSLAPCSLTELEIDFGVLASSAQRHRCFFYFRAPLPYDRMDPATAALYSDRHATGADAAAAEKLAALKRRIEAVLPERVRHYTARWEDDAVRGLEAWGQMVLEDLWREADAETADQILRGEPSWQDAERWALEQFVEDRARTFIGRDALLADLLALATSSPGEDHWGVCVTGPAGAGKSALFAQLMRRLAAEDVLVLGHSAGVSPRANQVDVMLRRWIDELASVVGVTEPLGEDASAEDVERAFHELLGRASTWRRVVVLLDALDQFEPTPRAQHLTWLPVLWSPNARLIATAIPGTQAEALIGRPGAEHRHMPPLDDGEAAGIVQAICARYHRAPHPAVVDAVLARQRVDGTRAAANPLWIELAVEELNLLDADDFRRAEREFTGPFDSRLHQLLLDVVGMMPPDVLDMYGWMLDRGEQVHGQAWARAFVNAIAVSRAGWREMDLRALLPALSGEPWDDDLRFAALRRTFRAHIVQRGALAQWDFAHAQLRLAVLQRNLADEQTLRGVHREIADYLQHLPREDALHETELMVHLIGADERMRAALYYASRLTAAENFGATIALGRHILSESAKAPNAALRWVTSLLEEPGLQGENQYRVASRFIGELDALLSNSATLSTRLAVLKAAEQALDGLVVRDPGNPEWQHGLSVSHTATADVLEAQGDLPGAGAAYRVALAIRERLARLHPDNTGCQRDLSIIHNRIGGALREQGDLAGAGAAYRAALAISERLARQDPSNTEWQLDLSSSHDRIGGVLRAQGDLAGVGAAYRAGLAIRERLARQDPSNTEWQSDLSISHNQTGDLLQAQGDLAGAASAYQAALAIRERLAQRNPGYAEGQWDLSSSYERVGGVLKAQGDSPGAVGAYRAALAIRERLAWLDPMNAEWQRGLWANHDDIGDVLKELGDLPGAIAAYRAALAIAERLTQLDPSNTQWQRDLSVSHNTTGDVLRAQGDLPGAGAAYRAALGIREHLVRLDPDNAEWQDAVSNSHERIGLVLQLQGDLAGAVAAYWAALAIRERLAQLDSENAKWQNDLSFTQGRVGDVLKAQGDLPGAGAAYRVALTIAERLARQDPTNSKWQRGLWANLEGIGDVLQAKADLPGAIAAHRAARAIAERLTQLDPGNAESQREVSISHDSIGIVLQRQGDLPGAIAAYRAALAIRERLARQDPGNVQWQRYLSISANKTGDVLQEQGDLPGAIAAYRAVLAIRERLAQLDASNTEWQHDLSLSHERIGIVLQAQGDLPGAGVAYRAALAITQGLAQLDPSNTEWRRGLSVCHTRIGDVLNTQNDLPGALSAYRAGHAITEKLAEQDPSNFEWQRDLFVSQQRIGTVLSAQGDLLGALRTHRQTLDIVERLAQHDPSNDQWQRDISVMHTNIGGVLRAQNDLPGALSAYRAALAIRARLVGQNHANTRSQLDFSATCDAIGHVLRAQGDLSGALTIYRSSLAVRARLARRDPNNALCQRALAASVENLATISGSDDRSNAVQEREAC